VATCCRKNRRLPALAVPAAVAAVGLAVSLGLTQQFDTAPPSNEGILVLQNGNLLRGTITRTDDRYHVAVDGGRIHVSVGDVLFTCRTLEEAYGQKRARIQPGVARDHLELAQWCQRHGLLEFAAQELVQAKAVEPRHPLIPLVEQRIKVSLCQPEGATRPAQPAELPPSPEELDRLVGGMPAGAVETFTQTIQPVLVNNCGAAACHGPGTESRYRLLRPGWGKPASRRLTQRNLHSTLEWVDRDDPSASPLLTAPLEAHGSADGAIFKAHEADQYQRIVDWVYQVAQKNHPPRSVPKEAEQPILGRSPARSSVLPAVHTAPGTPGRDGAFQLSPGVVPRNVPLPSQRFNPGSIRLAPDAWPTTSAAGMAATSPQQQRAPADPFDPEVFNHRFFPDRQRAQAGVVLPAATP
jgi:hypothetical protein